MNTQHVYDRLSEYIDGSLNSGERKTVEAHLFSCEACRKEYESLRKLVEELHELPKKFQLPATFFLNVEDRVNEHPQRDGEEIFMKRKNGAADELNRKSLTQNFSQHISFYRSWIVRIAAVLVVLAATGIVWFIVKNSGNGVPVVADRVDVPSKQQSTDGSIPAEIGKTQTAIAPNSSRKLAGERQPAASTFSRSDAMKSEARESNSKSIAIHPVESQKLIANAEETPEPVSVQATGMQQTNAKAAAPMLEESAALVGKISGRVMDKTTNDPLVGAAVLVVGKTLGAATDIHGKYTILNVPPGECTVRVNYVGYTQLEQTSVKVVEGKTTTLDFQLAPAKIELQPVTVTADAQLINKMATSSSQTVNSRSIENIPNVKSTQDVLRLQAGSAKEKGVSYSALRPPANEGRATEFQRVDKDDEGNTYFHTEEYGRIYENEFLDALKNPLSTFSIDVDAASYSNIRRFINGGQLPPKDAVRIEEMINYFTYDYPQPRNEHPFSITTEVAACPWNDDHQLVLIGLQGKKIATESLPSSNLVFLIDVSGSMDEPNKLPLVKSAFRLLVNQLRANDRVSIVVYASNTGLVLPSTSGNEKEKILDAIDRLEAGGSTAGGAGIQLAYKIAEENFLPNGNNRVILATDGDFNVGVSSTSELVRVVEEKREKGVFLSVLGFGTDNYKDERMEQLADKGNGNHFYIDNIQEAKKVFIGQMAGTLFTIAKDVKIQIEFNPAKVKAYRLIGYENRMLKKEDFNDDKKDAGELGAGHTVTALYEVVPADANIDLPSVDSLKYQNVQVGRDERAMKELLTVKFRYKEPTALTSKLIVKTLESDHDTFERASNNLQFAASVAEFGMLLRDSKYKTHASFDQVLEQSRRSKGDDVEGYRAEFIRLVESCRMLAK
ncbi:MAG: von Willebrand factor type A domain-containing protein [Ignavibacteriae bacterium]|nr:von Willebrand factor type A domain-containing protein [Ignavibacteria bacterium]MBI3363941.1 von Willebrand factor type A domain-containing protein [Ignavibacteriota bacterium]